MQDLASYARRPLAFSWRFVRRHAWAHGLILAAVALAVICSIFTQYGVKLLVDTLSLPQRHPAAVWNVFALLVGLIAADNLLWRLASWIGNGTFASVTGDVRRDLFRHLTGHAPSYFASWQPGVLTARISATSTAMFTVENLLVWNVLPPCMATLWAIALVGTVSVPMAAALVVVAAAVIAAMFLWAAAGKPLHHEFASRAAAVDGELTDVVGNMTMVKAFGGIAREHDRFDATVGQEIAARQRSLRYLERLRIVHALVTVVLTVGLLGWVLHLWQEGRATTGDVILVCTLGLSVLHATRDLAIALVDVTQHMARFSEALETLLVPHQLLDRPGARTLVRSGNSVELENVSFAYPDCPRLFNRLNFRIEGGQRVGLVGPSGGGKTSILALIQRFYDIEEGRILLAGEDITAVTQQSLREAIAVVPQDISLFHRPLLENIRYAQPRGQRRTGVGGRRRRALRLHRRAAAGPPHHGRRPRHAPLRRPAPARGAGARVPEGRAAPAARRADLGARQRNGGGRARDPGAADARPHRDRHHAPPLHRAPVRPHPGDTLGRAGAGRPAR